MTYQGLPNLGGLTRQNVDDTSRESNLLHDLSEFEGGQGGITRRFEYDRIAHGQSRCNLPGQHEQGEIPGNDLPYDPHRLVAGQFRGHELGPTGMIVKVAGNQRDIQVAGLADRFAIIQRFQHGQEARVFLDVTGNSIQVASAHMSWRLAPAFECCARRRHGRIDIGTIGSSDLCQRFTRRGINAIKVLTTGRFDPAVIDEQTEGLPLLNPL